EGIFFDGFDEIGEAGGAVVELGRDALHFEERGEACELGSKGGPSGGSKTLEMCVGKIRVRKERSELPGVSDAAGFEPGLNGVLAVRAGEFVFVIRGFQRRADFVFAPGKQVAIFGAKRGVAPDSAEALQAIVKSGGGPASGGRGIIQFVREACG